MQLLGKVEGESYGVDALASLDGLFRAVGQCGSAPHDLQERRRFPSACLSLQQQPIVIRNTLSLQYRINSIVFEVLNFILRTNLGSNGRQNGWKDLVLGRLRYVLSSKSCRAAVNEAVINC